MTASERLPNRKRIKMAKMGLTEILEDGEGIKEKGKCKLLGWKEVIGIPQGPVWK